MNIIRKLTSADSRWKIIILTVYSILLFIAVAKHEPWFDEAQAWLLARDAGFIELMVKYLRYEGSPGLWHLILMIPAKLGLPYISLNIVSAILAVAGAYLFIQYSPFHPAIKLLYPFSYFAFYQYGVVARSYSLLPVLLFSIAIIYRDRTRKPLFFYGLLILLANVSFHGVIIALSLALLHMFHVNWSWNEMAKRTKYLNLIAFAIFCTVIYLIKLQLELPEDIISVAGIKHDFSGLFKKCLPAFHNALFDDGFPNSPGSSFLDTYSGAISNVIIAITLFWLVLKRKLTVFVIPVMGLFIFFTMVYVHAWHTGVLFYTWLFALWISFEDLKGKTNKITGITKALVTFSLVFVLLINLYWTYNSFIYDYHQSYSASKETADYIKAEGLTGKKIYATNFHSISILPYFAGNIFSNYNGKRQPSFWIWSRQNSLYAEPYLSYEKYDPDIIILGIKNYSPNGENIHKPYIPDIPGFRFIRLFTGALYWKTGSLETDSFALYKKAR